ncbi:type II secretion system protein E [Acidithiobacillus marinus]|uniref:Type II secretion system protein E n=1 Tax=Acidithiobacillus marinus TaxID=187490 RepID=A0A2I1DPP3_9PROT|nr:ATPase, T2SS/T4P/T4SS family [Acidithiobacillus marinus]PKY11837.1 type II secretion system protein E [Acidithiobacillus marinus]
MAQESHAFISTSDRDGSVVHLLNDLFYQAAEEGWSDLHFETELDQSMRIRSRILGRLTTLETVKPHEGILILAKLRYRSKLAVDETRKEQDGRFVQEIEGRRVEIRLNIVPTVNGVSAVCRLLDSKNAGMPIENLGMPPEVESLYRWALQQKEGAIIAGGPTGSGKTTTLYAGIGAISRPDNKFITAEDPVEFVLPGIQQIPVGSGTGRTFASAIRAMMRQDPDDILIGEIRDEETAQMAARAAITGHKVLASIHANSANGVFSRLQDLGLPIHLMKAAIRVVFAQRIIKCVCPHCAQPQPVQYPEMLQDSGLPIPDSEMIGAGCEHCRGNPGYASRRVLFEAIKYDQAYRDALGDQEAMLAAAQKQPQFAPLTTWGARLVHEGVTNSKALFEGLSDVSD